MHTATEEAQDRPWLTHLTPEDRELLDELAKEYGSRTAVLREGMALLVKKRG